MFLDSGKCFWILGSVLSLWATIAFLVLQALSSALLARHSFRFAKTFPAIHVLVFQDFPRNPRPKYLDGQTFPDEQTFPRSWLDAFTLAKA